MSDLKEKLARLVYVAEQSGHYDGEDPVWHYGCFQRELDALVAELLPALAPTTVLFEMVIDPFGPHFAGSVVRVPLERAVELYQKEWADFGSNLTEAQQTEIKNFDLPAYWRKLTADR